MPSFAGQKRGHNGRPKGYSPHSPSSNAARSNGVAPPSNDSHHSKKPRNESNKPNDARKPSPHMNKQKKLLQKRKELPIWSQQSNIRAGLHGPKDIMLLVGETGSGKSTQVPQFFMTEKWCTKTIAITQPRRVAAISLARRVAEEMGTPMGSSSPASKVGYSVRFDTSVGPNTKIKFLTEGMLLQEMLRDPTLEQYSAVVVDEVHERSVNVDLILGFLRNLVCTKEGRKKRKGEALKVAVMSATADVEGLFKFFNQGSQEAEKKPITNGTTPSTPSGKESSVVEGKLNGKDGQQKHDSPSSSLEYTDTTWEGFSEDSSKEQTKSTPNGILKKQKEPTANGASKDRLPEESPAPKQLSIDDLTSKTISTCYIEGRQYPVTIKYLPDPAHDFLEIALQTIFQIHHKEPLPGDMLVFLTGQDTVEALEKLINEYAAQMDSEIPKVQVLPLFAALPQTMQQRVFHPAPPRTRKIILATNIAETSVTVPGVRYVIDGGKVKIKQFRNRLGLDSLLVKPISKSSAIQRMGRAGREAPGQCYRLYTEKAFFEMEQRTTPEILRCDLSQALLTMKSRGIGNVVNFPLLDPPPRESMEKALLQLLQLGCLTEEGKISPMGQKIAKLPLIPTLGRVLLEAASPERDCLLDVIDVIACLSVESIFINTNTEEAKEAAEEARKTLLRREGDHLTYLATVHAYANERSDRKAWTEKHFVNHRAMQNVLDIRKQLRQQCVQLKLLAKEDVPEPDALPSAPTEEGKDQILQCVLKGFCANTARLMPDGSYKTVIGNQTVAIHPSSTLFGRKVEAIVFSEFVFTNKSYARGVSVVRLTWVGEVLGAE